MKTDQSMKTRSPAAATSKVVDEVIKNPTDRFTSPSEVLGDTSLTRTQKEAILTSWVKDAELLAEAETENMGGGEKSRLRESKLALAALTDASPPGKPEA